MPPTDPPPSTQPPAEPSAPRLDLPAVLADAAKQQRTGAIGSLVGADLNVNLVRLDPHETIAAHINSEVDVLLVGVSGTGVVELESGDERLDAGSALYLPKTLRRAIHAGEQGLAYLTCHRRRAGLMPTPRTPRPGTR